MSTSIRTLAMLPLVAVMLTGCSSSDDTNDTLPDTTPDNETSQPSPNPGPNPTVLTTYDGSYIEACALVNPDEPSEGSEVVSMTISGDTGISRTFNYSDTACTTPEAVAEVALEFSVVYPGDTVETARGTADALNLTTESVTLDGRSPTQEEQVTINEQGTFDTVFDIILLEGSSLYTGNTDGDLDGSTTENRPTTLDSVPSIRQ